MDRVEQFNESKFVKSLAGIFAGIVLLNLALVIFKIPSWQVSRLFGMGQEGNFPTWYSSILYFIAGCVAFKNSLLFELKSIHRRNWRILSALLMFLSCDETAQIHEHTGQFLHKYFFSSMDLNASWVITLAPVALVVIFFLLKVVWKTLYLEPRPARFIIFGFILLITGAVVVETTTNFMDFESQKLLWNFEIILEETLEMLGVLMIIAGIQKYSKAKAAVL